MEAMDLIWRLAAIAVAAALVIGVLRRFDGEFSMLISIGAGCLLVTLCAGYLRTVLDYLSELRQIAGLNEAVLAPLLKTVGIGFVTKIAMTICADAGQNALAGFLEICGTILSVFVCLPLLRAVLELLQGLITGVF